MDKSLKRYIILGIGGIFALSVVFSAAYIVPEGHVAVVKHLGKADRQAGPGLQFKVPFFETTEQFEVRERKNVEEMAAATADQLPVTATVSVNWTVNKAAAKELYVKYGGLDQFESRVLDPRLRSATKAGIAKFSAAQLIRERMLVIAEIQKQIVAQTEGLPIHISNTQLENVVLPPIYMTAILAKEKAREDAKTEQHTLDKQKLVAQQKVQTAEAERDAVMAAADGEAYKLRTIADAESYRVKTEYTGRSEGVALLKAQLTPEYIAYLRAQQWNGVLPQTMLGGTAGTFLTLPANTSK